MRYPMLIVMASLSVVLFARTEIECVQSFLDALSHADVLPQGMQNAYASDICGPAIEEIGCGTNHFFDVVRSYCTNMCVTGDMSDKVCRARFKEALSLLENCAPADSGMTFAFCATNNNASPVLAKYAALAFAKTQGVDAAISFFESEGVRSLPPTRRASVCEGIAVAFEVEGGDCSATNKMVLLGLKALSEENGYWGEMDETLCCWWPAYATSSNRYVAALSARAADPPCVSSNYVDYVISTLEALAPGTMQTLSTNHLGAACQEP